MRNLVIRCEDDPSRPRFDGSPDLSAWNVYSVKVVSPLLAGTRGLKCRLWLERAGTEYASCGLEPDPVRRNARIGTLTVGDAAHAAAIDALVPSGTAGQCAVSMTLVCSVSDGTVARTDVPVTVAPKSAWRKEATA